MSRTYIGDWRVSRNHIIVLLGIIKSNPRMTQSDLLPAFRVLLLQKKTKKQYNYLVLAKQLWKYFWEDLKPLFCRWFKRSRSSVTDHEVRSLAVLKSQIFFFNRTIRSEGDQNYVSNFEMMMMTKVVAHLVRYLRACVYKFP